MQVQYQRDFSVCAVKTGLARGLPASGAVLRCRLFGDDDFSPSRQAVRGHAACGPFGWRGEACTGSVTGD